MAKPSEKEAREVEVMTHEYGTMGGGAGGWKREGDGLAEQRKVGFAFLWIF